MSVAHTSTVDTPAGPFTAIVASDGAVLASGWTGDIALLTPQIHPSLMPSEITHRNDLGDVTKAVVAYHEGDLTAIDPVEVRQRSGPFLQHAWDVLRTVRAGEPVTYSQYATMSGRPAAIRAAASACARNSVALFVPCHRVIRIGGNLGGFRWGLDVKRWLLAHER
ncbi:methylated-DNA-[protein]-cysteine S-methyltransferase [Lentzea xinjiangensis]|uniref:Methylated-DNA-[protein]-cysteine S-methyltransferase n=1 Tax=Lentzea xinjiangensis TaxID=402600 RepID=A0A1H9DQN6_9PSEU|nr:methylated-DNA--[protein]-cysteine S-methyltransferase [Lentzea xinjiangensis]SEQ15830.1 methylated-DNA-[protein]-cysteine S-methyltransferase [Lentzea xinjiangensis]